MEPRLNTNTEQTYVTHPAVMESRHFFHERERDT